MRHSAATAAHPFPIPMTRYFPRACAAVAVAASLVSVLAPAPALAQSPSDSALATALQFRSIGPALMGGRITSISAVPNATGQLGTVFVVGAATGGVWRSTNAGVSWAQIFDEIGRAHV